MDSFQLKDLKTLGLTGILEFNKRRFYAPSKPLAPHIHLGAMEIVFLQRGEQIYCVGNKEYHLRGMDVFLTYPNEWHSTNIHPEEKSKLYYMIIDTVHNQDHFLGIDDPRIAYLPQTLNSLPKRKFRGSEKISILWEKIYEIYDSDHPIRETIIQMYMLELFLEIIRCANESRTTITPDIERTSEYIREHASEYMTIESLAEISGLSVSRFKTKFRHQMGMPPGEYVQRERIGRAKQMLREGKSITFIAHELDYSSSQHFSNCFKKFVGISPSEYRKKQLQQP